jgi:hypothetical protein
MDNQGVVLPGAGGHINGTNSSKMNKRRIDFMTSDLLEDTADSATAMAEIFGIRNYSKAMYKSYKEKEYSGLCGSSCECEKCKTT